MQHSDKMLLGRLANALGIPYPVTRIRVDAAVGSHGVLEVWSYIRDGTEICEALKRYRLEEIEPEGTNPGARREFL